MPGCVGNVIGAAANIAPQAAIDKSFLVLFFKKELLSSFVANARSGMPNGHSTLRRWHFDEAGSVGGVIDALGGRVIIGRFGKEYVLHVALRIAVVEREPA